MLFALNAFLLLERRTDLRACSDHHSRSDSVHFLEHFPCVTLLSHSFYFTTFAFDYVAGLTGCLGDPPIGLIASHSCRLDGPVQSTSTGSRWCRTSLTRSSVSSDEPPAETGMTTSRFSGPILWISALAFQTHATNCLVHPSAWRMPSLPDFQRTSILALCCSH